MIGLAHTPLRSLLARLAFAGALAATLAPTLSYVHEASVPHRLCLEHGELMDAPPPDARLAPVRWSYQSLSRDDAPRTAGEHHHCSLVPQRLAPAAGALEPPGAHPIVAVATLTPATPSSQPASDLLLFAPKTSPPR
jgi:hypothetical protein